MMFSYPDFYVSLVFHSPHSVIFYSLTHFYSSKYHSSSTNSYVNSFTIISIQHIIYLYFLGLSFTLIPIVFVIKFNVFVFSTFSDQLYQKFVIRITLELQWFHILKELRKFNWHILAQVLYLNLHLHSPHNLRFLLVTHILQILPR